MSWLRSLRESVQRRSDPGRPVDAAAGAVTEAEPSGVLAPLAFPARRRRAEPGVVRAMPVVLRIERGAPPSRTPLLEAAAAAALAVCLDERSEPGGEWHDDVAAWVDGRIRKVTRRARGTHWDVVQDLPGVTVTVAGAAARALLPCPVDETPREVSRLQISGTDLDPDTPGPPPDGVPVVWLNPDLELTVGKAAAQVGHATMLLAARSRPAEVERWRADGWRLAVRTADPARWPALRADVEAGRAVAVRDAGFTEVAPGTMTCIATQPATGSR